MFNRKFSSNIRRRKRMIKSTIILLVVFLSIGYSAFSSNLGINGTLNVSKYDQTLYGVLEKAVSKGYAQEYTGEHHDSFTEEPSQKIYHWLDNSVNTLTIQSKDNVIFADHCWQMIRTTDTGGVKMVYNGEAEDGKCLNTRGNHVGYARKDTQSMSTAYYYGTDYTYDKTHNTFSLSGTITTGTIQPGQYTCKQITSTGTCTTLYLVDTLSSGTTYYVLQLNANSHYSQFGRLQYNVNSNSPANVGYMYNTVYPSNLMNSLIEPMISNESQINTSYYYADSYDYNETNTNEYTLTNPYQISSSDDYASLVGKYTLRSTSSTYSNTSIYYIAAVGWYWMYSIELEDGNNLAYYNSSYTYGDSYTDNGDGTYTINNPTTINKIDYTDEIMMNKYICKDAINNTCSDVWHSTENFDSNPRYLYYFKSSDIYKFAKGYVYNPETGKYTLDSDNVTLWDTHTTDSEDSISTHHYTCFNVSGECSTISYVFHASIGKLYYINLTGGKSVEDAQNEMLLNNNINQINSTIKTGIDAWYKKYMTMYTSALEDTIFCNDRSIRNIGGWNPDEGNVTSALEFNGYNNNMSCSNITDKFSLANSNAQLTYPVGLLNYLEAKLVNAYKVLKTGQDWWLNSPYDFSFDRALVLTVGTYGYSTNDADHDYGVRPTISLKPGTEYKAGDGSMEKPYIVE